MLEEILRSKILQSGKLNIEELDKIHYVQKHNKKCPVVFMNEPFENCTELLYDWGIDHGNNIEWYTGMTQCHKSFKIKKLRIFCKDHRPFAHPSGDNLDLALKACKKAVCFIWFVKTGVRTLEKQLIWEQRNAGFALINKQLYNNYESN